MTEYKPSVNFPSKERIPNNITVKLKKFKPQPLELTLCFLPTHWVVSLSLSLSSITVNKMRGKWPWEILRARSAHTPKDVDGHFCFLAIIFCFTHDLKNLGVSVYCKLCSNFCWALYFALLWSIVYKLTRGYFELQCNSLLFQLTWSWGWFNNSDGQC